MGDINIGSLDKSQSRFGKRIPIRVDLTPMVDLGFLLITFFIFTTTIGEPKAMPLKLPADSKDSMRTSETTTMHLIIGGQQQIVAYSGTDLNQLQAARLSDGSLRSLLIAKKNQVAVLTGKANDLVVLIKPTVQSSYQSIVDVLDEMTINGISRYVFIEPNEVEQLMVSKWSE
jgi:biopolymer transport protein ExbD